MSTVEPSNSPREKGDDAGKRLSYKFQRLRERIRDAIETGELAGKLPGERVLARRFKVNAKTLSKALTELAAEGVLQRNVGLGTFVRGTEPNQNKDQVLFLIDPPQANSRVLKLLINQPDFNVRVHADMDNITPSLISAHGWIVVYSQTLSEEAIRDLAVRGNNVILFGRHANLYSIHSICYDYVGATVDLIRKLAFQGHRKILLSGCNVHSKSCEEVMQALPPGVELVTTTREEIASHLPSKPTAVICTSHSLAEKIISDMQQAGMSIPGDMSVVSMGIAKGEELVTGLYIKPQEVIDAIHHVTLEATSNRPVRIWLTGHYRVYNTSRAIS